MSGVLWTGHFRVYYNNRDDYPFVWSVDRGTVETERKFQHVQIEVPVRGRCCMSSDNRKEPKAWIQGSGTVRQSGDMCVIRLIQQQ